MALIQKITLRTRKSLYNIDYVGMVSSGKMPCQLFFSHGYREVVLRGNGVKLRKVQGHPAEIVPLGIQSSYPVDIMRAKVLLPYFPASDPSQLSKGRGPA